jgi:hypothetical protein
MKSRLFSFILIITIFGLFYAQNLCVFAQGEMITTPTFPYCTDPQGVVKITYTEGIHGIPGNYNTNVGSDTVYYLSDDTLMQCFCSINGDGTQTNWWKVSSLTLDQVETLLGWGWTYIPDGSAWGLVEAPYVAFNSSYLCEDVDTDDGEDETDDNNDEDKNDQNDDERVGAVLGIGGQVLGLATTGNISDLYLPLGTGIMSTSLLAFWLFKKKQ